MHKKVNHITVWYADVSAHKSFVDKLSAIFSQHQISLQPLANKSSEMSGIVLVGGRDYYDDLISILNLRLKPRGDRIIVINTSAIHFSSAEVMKVLNYGAEYFIESTLFEEHFESLTDKLKRWRNIESILESQTVKQTIIGETQKIKKLLRNVIEIALYSEASVLVMGERGTGKELIARLLHNIQASGVPGELVLVDCTTVKPELSGSEFFGHEKGSYTGADRTREGAFALAHNGTLFLDEVGELPSQMQAELLRIIQEGAYKKLGSNVWRQTKFRLVCATNRNLEEETEAGNFRKDLLDRISLWKCYMPPLNERKEDIPLLAEFFFKKSFPETTPLIDDAVISYLTQRNYPGNIRELQNLIKRICLRYIGKGPITLGDISEYDRINFEAKESIWFENPDLAHAISDALSSGYDAKNIIDTIKTLTTKIALSLTGNNKEMSQLLGKSERWIQLQKQK